MLRFAVTFLVAILFVNSRPELPPLAGVLALIIVPVLSIFFRPRWFLPLAGGFLGVVWMSLHAHLLWQPLGAQLVHKEFIVEGRVTGLPNIRQARQSVEFKVLRVQPPVDSPPKKVLLVDYQGLSLEPGQEWRLKVLFKPPRGLRNAAGFDMETWLYRQGISAVVYHRASETTALLGTKWSLNGWRWKISQALKDHVSPQHLGMVQALVVGDKQNISDRQWRSLQATGTNHLMAISGLHIGLVASGVFFLTFQLVRLFPSLCHRMAAARWAAILAILAALAYAALAGFAIPTQRAMIMICVFMWDLLRLRPSRPSRVLGLSLFLVLLWDPLASLSAGFYLSFAAVFSIYLVIHYRRHGRSWLANLVRIQWAVTLGLIPVLIYSFSQFSLVAPLVNLIVVPLVAVFVVPVLLLASACLLLGEFPATLFFTLADHGLWLSQTIIEGCAQWPAAKVSLQLTPMALMSVAVGVGLLLLPRGMPVKGLAIAYFLPMMFHPPVKPPQGEMWLTLFDVGQGLAILVETDGHSMVYDTGPPMGRTDAAKGLILPQLRLAGRDKLDLMVVSHGDADHSGGAQSLYTGIKVDQLWVGGGWHFKDATACLKGQQARLGELSIEVLGPEEGEPSGNNASCILRLSYGANRILLTGDVEYEGEYPLMLQDVSAQVLQIPHHGSRTSSSVEFIQAVSPKVGLVSAGYANRFGHPHGQVLTRYINNGVQLLDTSKTGAVRLVFSRHQGTFTTHLLWSNHRRYWHRQ